MTTIRLYWNNVCILSRQERMFLDQIRESLSSQGIDLQVTYFGLGCPFHMSQYLAQPEAELPDLLVSTDLEVFEDRRIFDKLQAGGLHPLADLFPVKDDPILAVLHRGPALLPYLAIPLVFYGDGRAFQEDASLSLSGLVRERYPLAFGGSGNSAAKTVVKTIWEEGGEELVHVLLKNSVVTGMPIQAFNRVRTGQSPLALVPSVYALRADGQETRIFCPSDGAVAVPSYLCARASADLSAAAAVIKALRAPKISRFFVESGNLVSCAPDSPDEPWLRSVHGRLRLPSMEFLEKLAPERFEEVYGRYHPSL